MRLEEDHGNLAHCASPGNARDGAVKEVTILSGPRVYHSAVRDAMMQYKCISDSGEVTATQEFGFKID